MRSTPTCSVLSDVGEARGRGRGGGRSGPGGGGPARHGPAGLALGALLHDIGKNGEGGHVPVGAGGRPILDRIGVDAATGDLVAFLVAQHLLLSDTGDAADLTDENLILDVAAAVGTPDRLAALYLLAKADAEATGPAAWTPWRAPDPRARRQGPARARTWRDGHRDRGGPRRPCRPRPRVPRA